MGSCQIGTDRRTKRVFESRGRRSGMRWRGLDRHRSSTVSQLASTPTYSGLLMVIRTPLVRRSSHASGMSRRSVPFLTTVIPVEGHSVVICGPSSTIRRSLDGLPRNTPTSVCVSVSTVTVSASRTSPASVVTVTSIVRGDPETFVNSTSFGGWSERPNAVQPAIVVTAPQLKPRKPRREIGLINVSLVE